MKITIKMGLFFAGVVTVFGLIILWNQSYSSPPRVLQLEEEVQVTAEVGSCALEVTVHPEKRVPASANWSTELTIDIYDSGTNIFQGTVTGTTNNLGVANIDVCNQSLVLGSGTYDFYVRGTSHLRRGYFNYVAFNSTLTSIDFTPDSDLLAGETSVVYDNYINSLDLSTQISTLYTNDNVNDLNQDGIVNSLDISNTITNFFIEGD